jgi:hypothetical protein
VADCARQFREFPDIDLDNEQFVSDLKIHPLQQAPQEVLHGASAPLRCPLCRVRAIGSQLPLDAAHWRNHIAYCDKRRFAKASTSCSVLKPTGVLVVVCY